VGGLAGAAQHGGLGIHAEHGPHPAGQRQGQLAGAAAQVDHHVRGGQAEHAGQQVDDDLGVAVPVPLVELGYFSPERRHPVMMHQRSGQFPAQAAASLTAEAVRRRLAGRGGPGALV
jgi:hypothetical protein